MKVLITGAGGFVGWVLATYMLIQGQQITATQRKPHPEFVSRVDKIKIERCVVWS